MRIEPARGARAHPKYRAADGEVVPGVTTVLGIIDKPALKTWANEVGLAGYSVGKYVDAMAVVGTLAHYMIECDLKGVSPDIADYSANEIDRALVSYHKFVAWREEHDFELILSEWGLVSEQHRYGGTIDCYCLLDGKYTLLDFKTSKAIYDEMEYQVNGGYKPLAIENGFQVDQTRILQIGRNPDEGFTDRLCNPDHSLDQRIFLGALETYTAIHKKKGFIKAELKAQKAAETPLEISALSKSVGGGGARQMKEASAAQPTILTIVK